MTRPASVRPVTASVVVDSREPPGVQAALLAGLTSVPGVVSLVTALETGDVVIRDGCAPPCLVAIERKRVGDLLGSFRSGRLGKQLARMLATYPFPILLVEGEFRVDREGHVVAGRHTTRWSHAAVQMYLWSIQRRGIDVLYTPDIPATADVVRALAKRAALGCVAHLDLEAPCAPTSTAASAPRARRRTAPA